MLPGQGTQEGPHHGRVVCSLDWQFSEDGSCPSFPFMLGGLNPEVCVGGSTQIRRLFKKMLVCKDVSRVS